MTDTPNATRKRAAATITALLALPLLIGSLAACSAGPEASTTEASGSAQTADDWQVDYEDCMREAGVDFSDKSADITMDSAFAAADESCKEKLGPSPAGDGKKPSADEKQEAYERQQKVADCLREAGYDVPDPDENGALSGMPDTVTQDALLACAPADDGAGQVSFG